MGKPVTLLESICAYTLTFRGKSLVVEHKDGREMVFAYVGNIGQKIAAFASESSDAKELRQNLYAAAKKPLRFASAGAIYDIKVRDFDSFGEDGFEVTIEPAAKLDPARAPQFTAKQGQYLAFIHNYTKINRQAPAESDMERHFRVTPPSIHEMVKTLERNGLIERTPGKARSIRILVRPEYIPPLK